MRNNIDVLRFRLKDHVDFEGSRDFIKVKDIQGDSKRIREYTNVEESLTINFETLFRYYKEGKIEILEGNLNELE